MGKASGKKKAIHTVTSSPNVDSDDKIGSLMSKASTKGLIVAILLLSFAVYFNTLFNEFVYDDDLQVVKNQWIRSVRHVPEIFSKSVWNFRDTLPSSYYRPMMHMIYMLNYHVFGLKPWGFHLINILFHAGVSVLVFMIMLRLLKETFPESDRHVLPAFVAAMLFASHPVHSEAVAWIAGVPDLSYAFFYLLSFYFYIRSGAGDDKLGYTLSVVTFTLAAFCKEPALTLPVLLVAYDFTFKRGLDLRARTMRYIPYLLVSGVYIFLRIHALKGFAPNARHTELNTYQYIINVFPLFGQYLEKLLLPTNLNVFHVFHPITSILDIRGILFVAVFVVFVVLAFITFRKNKTAFLGFVFIFVPLLPALYIPAVGWNTFAERYIYLPSFGFVILLALLVQWLKLTKTKLAVYVSIGLIGLTTAIYSVGTITRNITWKDNYSLWTDSVKKSPDGFIPHDNLGLAYTDRGLIDKAIEQFESAVKIEPTYPEAHANLGNVYNYKGMFNEAIEQLQAAIQLRPKNPEAYNNLGIAYYGKGLFDKAIESYQTSLKLRPENENVYFNLATAYYGRGFLDKSIECYQTALVLDPKDAEAHKNLGIIYEKKGLKDKAINELEIALKINPTFAEARKALQVLHQQKP